jgi:phenylacetate-CoA ligase
MQPLEKLYPHVPLWMQNFGISLYGVFYRHERLGRDFGKRVSEFRERDHWAPEKMQTYLEQRLRHMLIHAYENVPHYRSTWSALGITAKELARFRQSDLSALSITRKQDVRLNPTSFVATNVANKARLVRYYTSGSTGTPVTCFFSASGHRSFFAAREVRSFGWAGVSIRSPRSMVGGRMVAPRGDSAPPYYRYNWAEREVYFSAFHITPEFVSDYVSGLNRYQPKVLTGYAHSHYVLARLMLEAGLRLNYKPDALVLSSEKLTPPMKSIIREAFNARPFEEYGTVEQCVLATECEAGNLHINSDFGIVEIVDEQGRPVPHGCEGRMVCTGLLNEAQPLIRYDIGDLAAWSAERCGCGRDHLPVLKGVVGRLEDAVMSRDGREMVRFHGVFIDVPHLIEGQVVQETLDLMRLRVVVTREFGSAQEELIRSRVIARLGQIGVSIERVDALERTERGKFRSVVSKVTASSANGEAQGCAPVAAQQR